MCGHLARQSPSVEAMVAVMAMAVAVMVVVVMVSMVAMVAVVAVVAVVVVVQPPAAAVDVPIRLIPAGGRSHFIRPK